MPFQTIFTSFYHEINHQDHHCNLDHCIKINCLFVGVLAIQVKKSFVLLVICEDIYHYQDDMTEMTLTEITSQGPGCFLTCVVSFDCLIKSTGFCNFGQIQTFLWQSKTLLIYFINLKVMVFLERGDQELSIGSLISLLPFRLVGWNFTWKLTILTVENAKFVKSRKKYKMAETPLSSGQNAFPRSFFLGFGGVFVLKSAFGFLIRAPEVPFLVPLKSVNYPKSGLVLAFQGYQKWYFRCPNQKSENTFQYKYPPKT